MLFGREYPAGWRDGSGRSIPPDPMPMSYVYAPPAYAGSYVDEKNGAEGREYDVLGLVAALRLKGQIALPVLVGDGGLGGRMLRDRRDEIAEEG
jgi:hypothetical protein